MKGEYYFLLGLWLFVIVSGKFLINQAKARRQEQIILESDEQAELDRARRAKEIKSERDRVRKSRSRTRTWR